MSFRTILVFAAASILSIAQTQPKSPPTKAATAPIFSLSSGDRKFLEEAIKGGRMEVALGKLASERAMDPQVKAYGEMMVKDHTQGNTELEAFAKEHGLTVPAEKESSTQAKLMKLNGAAFDKAYIADMVNDHRKDISEFEKASRNASSTDVRRLATKMHPTLQMHLDRAHVLHDQINKGTADRTTPDATPTDRK